MVLSCIKKKHLNKSVIVIFSTLAIPYPHGFVFSWEHEIILLKYTPVILFLSSFFFLLSLSFWKVDSASWASGPVGALGVPMYIRPTAGVTMPSVYLLFPLQPPHCIIVLIHMYLNHRSSASSSVRSVLSLYLQALWPIAHLTEHNL